MTAFIDEHRGTYGVEPICKVLPIAPSTYYQHVARRADPELRPKRSWRDDALCEAIRWVWEENLQVYVPPAEAEAACYQQPRELAMAA